MKMMKRKRRELTITWPGNQVISGKKKSLADAKDYFWQGRRDSNSQHPVLETGALPIELRP